MSAVVLLAAAALALAWANSPWAGAYEALWHLRLGLGVAQYLPAHDLRFWFNDGLMSVFFLVVGLEIRREMHDGALSDPRVAALPIIAATGGVVVPALLYVLINPGPAARSEEHTSELQSRSDLVCRLLLEKKKKEKIQSRLKATYICEQ